MRKQLGILASLVFLGVSALLWTGCSNCCKDTCSQPCEPICQPECPPPCKPVCPAPCKPVCPPVCEEPCAPPCAPPCPAPCPAPCKPVCAPPCKPVCAPPCEPPCVRCAPRLKPCVHGPSGQCSCNGVTVTARNPNMCMLGDQYPLDVEVTACCDVCDVVLTTKLPEGVTFLRSTPEAKVDGRIVTWDFGSINKGQTICGKIWLKCEREGDICTCFCVQATPVAFCALLCAKPVLTCEKCGPAEVCPGDPIEYTITVSNIGTCTAKEVVVVDNLPDGVDHASGQKTLNFRLGDLEPCQSKKVNICATACKRGKVTNVAIASACNANQTSCQATTCICCCAVECQKVGPKEVPVGQNADYQITVTNTGDKTLHEVVVTDTAPSATAIVAAPGAKVCDKQAVWKLRELKAGEKMTFNTTLTTCTPGFFVNRATVTTCEGCNGCCEAGTQWKGRPALDTCVESSENPICVGETTRFRIVVTNKGQEYDSNVNVVATFPSGLTPVNASGATAGQINGQTVNFAPIANLAPRQTLEFYVTVKATSAGDLRPKIQVSSDFIKNPITEEESLIVN